MTEKRYDVKYAILGLDNAGKSSFIQAFRQIYGFEEKLETIQPTIRIDHIKYQIFDINVHFWDFGGQTAYREQYLREPQSFSNISVLLYIIDIQDEDRFSLAMNYLEGILTLLKECEYSSPIPIQICFNKCDGPLLTKDLMDYQDRIGMLEKLITKRFTNFRFEFHSTSIYDLWSIVRMISQPIHSISLIFNKIHKLLEDFAQKHEISYAILTNQQGFIISEYSITPTKFFSQDNPISITLNHHLRIQKQMAEKKIEVPHVRDVVGSLEIWCETFPINAPQTNKCCLGLFFQKNEEESLQTQEILQDKVNDFIKSLQTTFKSYFT